MFNTYFVVLHYQAINETVDCVKSLKQLNTDMSISHIFVVDNASPNKSGKQLQELYKDDKYVDVILSDSNLGFAKGNNLGFMKAKGAMADFIVLINNDTLIKDSLFLDKLSSIYERTKFAVLGPDILSIKDQVHQNPMSGLDMSPTSLRKRIIKAKLILSANKLGLTKLLMSKRNTNNVYKNNYKEEKIIDLNSNLVLQGSCLIFSKEYIERFDGLYDGTFMYYEENILAYRCFSNNLKMVYSPEIQIEHYRNVSTNIAFDKDKDKRKLDFFYKQTVKSLSLLLNMVKE